jgi:hypothetical protein
LVVHHYFRALPDWLAALPDARAPARLRYPVAHLCWTALLMFLGHCRSRRGLNAITAQRGTAVYANLRALGVPPNTDGSTTVAHGDTLHYFLTALPHAALAALAVRHVHAVLRSKVLDACRLRGTHWLVAVDGTETISFWHRHCAQCLTQRQPDGSLRYYHPVLEAKLVTPCGFTMHLASTCIENPNPNPDKQECERTAFPLLAAQLKQDFPRLPLCLLGDSLYAVEPVLATCEANHWSYLLVLKPGVQPTLWAAVLRRLPTAPTLVHTVFPRGSPVRRQQYWWLCHLDCQGHPTHVLVLDEDRWEKGQLRRHRYAWITDLRPDQHNVAELANQGGRPRWQIEEAFNDQKTGGWELAHAYGGTGDTWRHYYVWLQLAHLYQQLLRYSDVLRALARRATRAAAPPAATFARQFGSLRAFARELVEGWRRDPPGPLLAAARALAPTVRLHLDTS